MDKPLYTRKLDPKVHKKIDAIVKKTGLTKWLIVEALLAKTLKVKTKNDLDLSKWIK